MVTASHESAPAPAVVDMGEKQNDDSVVGRQPFFDDHRPLGISLVGRVGVLELVVSFPGPAAVLAEGVIAPPVGVVVAGVGIEGCDVAVRIFQTDRPPVRASSRSVVLQVGDDVAEDVVPEPGGRIVIVDRRPFDGFILDGLWPGCGVLGERHEGGTGQKQDDRNHNRSIHRNSLPKPRCSLRAADATIADAEAAIEPVGAGC